MSKPEKCFCDTYRKCVKEPETQVSIGYNTVEEKTQYIDGETFVRRADQECEGTLVFISRTALAACSEAVQIDDDIVTFPRDAVSLQCEYLRKQS